MSHPSRRNLFVISLYAWPCGRCKIRFEGGSKGLMASVQCTPCGMSIEERVRKMRKIDRMLTRANKVIGS